MTTACCAVVAPMFLAGADTPRKELPQISFTVQGNQVVAQMADYKAVALEIKFDAERGILTLNGNSQSLAILQRKSPSREADIYKSEKITLELKSEAIRTVGTRTITSGVAK
jgi:hypothetical protein